MCTPQAYIATRVLQSYTQYQSDKAKANNINRDTQTKAETLRNEAIYTDNAFIRKKEEADQKASFQKAQISDRKLQVEGSARASLGEKGVGGNLFVSVLGDIARNAGKQLNTVDLNYENKIRGIATNRLAQNRMYSNQILKLPRAYKPSWATYALEASVDIGGMYMANSAPKASSAVDQGVLVGDM